MNDLWVGDPPLVVGDAVIVSMGYRVASLGVADGAVRWDIELSDIEEDLDIGADPLFATGPILGGSSHGKVFALDPANGAPRWSRQIPRGDKTIWRMAVVGDTVLIHDDDDYISGMPVATGASPWAVDAKAAGPIAALGSDAAISLSDGGILVLKPVDGAEKARLPGVAVAMLPMPGDTPTLAVAGVGSLQALNADGSVGWSSPVPFQASEVVAGPSDLVLTDTEGNLAVYHLT